MAEPRRWLCIAYSFPPISRSGTHRTLGFVRHLNEWGWPATVVAAEADGEPVDRALVDRVPSETNVLRVRRVDRVESWKKRLGSVGRRWCGGAAGGRDVRGRGSSPAQEAESAGDGVDRSNFHFLRGPVDWVTRAMQVPDDKAGWILPAAAAALKALQRERHAVLYSTSPCASAHLAALAVKRRTGLPWIADFRDPWTDNPFREVAYRSLRWWDARLERRVFRFADVVVCNTPTLRGRLLERRVRSAEDSVTILNGFDAESLSSVKPLRLASADDVVLTHCGQFYGPRSPLPWFQALKQATERLAEARRLRLHLIGERAYQGRDLMDWARDCGVGDRVVVEGRVSHAEALSRAAGSDVVILAGSNGPGAELQIPNKLFEYLVLRRPILAAVSDDHPARDILRQARAASVVCRPDDTDALAGAFLRMARQLPFPEPCDFGEVERFDRRHRAEELLGVFRALTSGSKSPANRPAEQPVMSGPKGASSHPSPEPRGAQALAGASGAPR